MNVARCMIPDKSVLLHSKFVDNLIFYNVIVVKYIESLYFTNWTLETSF